MRRQLKSRKLIPADIRLLTPYGLVILSAFFIGGVFAAVFAFTLPELSEKELLLYLEDFFRNIKGNGTDATALFRHSLLSNLQNFGIFFCLSVMLIGAPFLAIFAGVLGFMESFTLFFLFRLYGIRAALFALLGILPHALLLAPAYLLALSTSLRHAVTLFGEGKELKTRIIRLALTLLSLFALTIGASLLQAYIEPLLIRLIAELFIS